MLRPGRMRRNRKIPGVPAPARWRVPLPRALRAEHALQEPTTLTRSGIHLCLPPQRITTRLSPPLVRLSVTEDAPSQPGSGGAESVAISGRWDKTRDVDIGTRQTLHMVVHGCSPNGVGSEPERCLRSLRNRVSGNVRGGPERLPLQCGIPVQS